MIPANRITVLHVLVVTMSTIPLAVLAERPLPLQLGAHVVLHLPFDDAQEFLPTNAVAAGATFSETGKVNGACAFGRDGGHILIENPAGLPEKRAPRTVAIWFRMNSYDRRAVIGGYGNPGKGENFQIESGAGRQFWIMGWGASRDWGTRVSTEPYFDDGWHHIALTYDSRMTKVFLDGIMSASTSDFNWDTRPSRVVIGDEIDLSGRPFEGLVDEFMIFNSALSASEVRRLVDWAK